MAALTVWKNSASAASDTSHCHQHFGKLDRQSAANIQIPLFKRLRCVGLLVAKELKGRSVKDPFRYFDKGNIAVVGKNYAVLEWGWLRTSGFLTWLVWLHVHILSPPQSQNRLRAKHQWLRSYFTGARSDAAAYTGCFSGRGTADNLTMWMALRNAVVQQ